MLHRVIAGLPEHGAVLRGVEYWDEVSALLLELEVEAYTVARDQRTTVWILNLP